MEDLGRNRQFYLQKILFTQKTQENKLLDLVRKFIQVAVYKMNT